MIKSSLTVAEIRRPCWLPNFILQCLTSVLSLPASYSNSSLIISDSLSALTAISDPYFSHPIVTRIFTLLTTFNSSTLTVSFMWVPNHCGIGGNEKVDAKAAANHPRISVSVHIYCLLNPISFFSDAAWYIITGPNFDRIKSLFAINHTRTNKKFYHLVAFIRPNLSQTRNLPHQTPYRPHSCHSLTPTIQFVPPYLSPLHIRFTSYR